MKDIIHSLFRLWIRVTSYFFFEKIEISGTENLPLDCPVILACNHPNSFLDSIVLTTSTKRELHYTARGDFFQSKVASSLLDYINILPVFRKEEGKEQLYKNDETFSYCMDVLKKNGAIVIYPEGLCENEYDLRPLRKGTARLAFEAWNNPDIGHKLKVVPVAIHYSSWLKTSPRVFVEFLENIEKKSFTGLTESGLFNKKFNEQLKAKLLEKCDVVDISRDVTSQNKLIGFMLKNLRNGAATAKELQDKYLKLSNEPFTENYKSLSDYLIKEKINYYKESNVGIINFIYSVLIFIIAFILNSLPYYLSKFIVKKSINDNSFFDSLIYSVLMLVYPIYILIIFFVLKCYFDFWLGIAAVLLVLVSASYYDRSKRIIQCFLKKDKLKTVYQILNRLFETSNG